MQGEYEKRKSVPAENSLSDNFSSHSAMVSEQPG
jgi:hypothetical protein